jgi:uncharacterized membrane protein YgdD (TMEM256/DUF423 family)
MSRWAYIVSSVAALAGAAGIMELAAAAHAISNPLLKISADFLLVNATAVIAISTLSVGAARRKGWLLITATMLLCGSLLFAGELSAHVFLGRRFLPLAAPIGGGMTILGWLASAIAAFACAFQKRAHGGSEHTT